MRVAYLVNQYPKVSHTFIRRELRALEAQGVEVVRYALRRVAEPLADPADRDEQARTRVVLDQGPRGLAAALAWQSARRPVAFARAASLASRVGLGSDRGVLVHAAYLAEACVLAGWAAQDGVEHVHAHFGTNSAAVAMLLEALGGPGYSVTVHGPEEFDKPQAIALREKLERARFACAISSFGRSQLYRWVGQAHWSKVHVVRCGVDTAFVESASAPIPDEPRLVHVGRLSEQKGQWLLIEALAALAREGRRFSMTILGDGELRPVLERAILSHGLGEQVRIAGWASEAEVREALVRARVLVLPSFAEGLPVVLMEALALGRPVIASAVAGIPELVASGENGWLVTPGSVDSLVDALREALTAPASELAAMGARGRRAVLERHDVRDSAASLRALFEEHARQPEPAAGAR